MKRQSPMKPPSPSEVTSYAKEIGLDLDGEYFCNYYEMRGWEIKKGLRMKNWQAAVRYWKSLRNPKPKLTLIDKTHEIMKSIDKTRLSASER